MFILKKTQKSLLFLSVILISALIFTGAVSVFQTAEIKNDGSGTLNFSYSADETLLKSKNYLIGNLPFDQEKIKEYFASPNNVVKRGFVVKDKKDTNLLRTTVNIEFKDISKITTAKGFEGISARWNGTDTGTVFRWIIPKEYAESNMLEKITYSFTFESEIKSTNGTIKEKTITWFRDIGKLDSLNTIVFTATLNNEGVASGENEKKSCGIFGLELPLVILAGLIFNSRFRNFRK